MHVLCLLCVPSCFSLALVLYVDVPLKHVLYINVKITFGKKSFVNRDPTMASKIPLPDSEMVELREIFNLVDEDNSGSISKDELAELLRTLGVEKTQVCSFSFLN